MKKFGKIGLLAMFAIAAACGSARLVNRNAGGGTFALQGDRGQAMKDATSQMAQHCGPAGYDVISEGEVAIGTDTAARADTYGNRDGSVTQTAGQSTRTATEWRVEYRCRGAAPAPAPMGPPTAPPPAPPAPGY